MDPICQTDEFGNPINPLQQSSSVTGGHETTGTGTGYGGTTTTGTTGAGHHGGVGGVLNRSGSSSSSSSSEDDGMGGRRKKGIKEKIKEKLPGGRKDQSAGTTGTTHEKKGMMGKIKEKLPGHHGP